MQPGKRGVFCFLSCMDTFLGTVRGEQLAVAGLDFSLLLSPLLFSLCLFTYFLFFPDFYLEFLLILKNFSQIEVLSILHMETKIQ